ncbi:MAG: hypothetical protein M0P57_08880 [Syntrophales bacterium]|nr:hypothetical protein [Syntrophales bacterium]MDY0044869.1 hypothetical protein [Syntrophales bacterium]
MQGSHALTAAQLRIFKNHIEKIKQEPKLKTVFIASMATLFWVFSFVLFNKGLSFFFEIPVIGPALMDEAIYIFFAVLFIMLTLSSIVVCYTTFYRPKELEFLFSKPINHKVIFLYRFIQSSIFSSWAFLFLGLPFFIVYASIKTAPFWFYLALPFYFAVFVLLPTALSSIIILTAVRFVSYRRIKHFLFTAAAAGVIFLYWYYHSHLSASVLPRVDIGYFFETFLSHLKILKHPFFPGYWMAKSVIGAGTGNASEAAVYFTGFFATSLVAMQANWLLAENGFYRGWLATKSGSNKKTHPPEKGILNRILLILTILPRPAAALVIKDIKIFIRDFSQWSQFMIYIAILGIYIFNLRNIPMSQGNPYWMLIVTFLNLSATALVLAGFTVRFLYPLISLEGAKIWILGLAPVTFRGIILQKFATNLIVIVFVSEFLMISTNFMLRTSTMLFYTSCGLAFLISTGLVGLSVGLGSIYPNFKEDNPSKIVSGFGGTLNFVTALVYVLLLILLFALPTFNYEIRQSLTKGMYYLLISCAWIIAVVMSAATGILPLIIGCRKLERGDF